MTDDRPVPAEHSAAGQSDGDAEQPEGERGAAAPSAEGQGFWHGRSALLMPALLTAFSLFLLIGAAVIPAGDTDFPGPRFFPIILGCAGLVLAALLALGVLRTPEPVAETSGRSFRTHSDFVSLAWVVGGFLAFALLLPWLGWILAGALVFWCTAHGFGSRRPLFDILTALFLSSVIYLVFGTGLGLNLPSGILGGGF
ncbi:MAG: tripartite tricarboxylate transporter TctB family protein [Brachybacterium sp.]|uniref:tripartite tricarboxylate transporter TctB family protein n=1 Tax=Brachybacterium sp. TaxID=1891286 RepID=UPI003F9135CF